MVLTPRAKCRRDSGLKSGIGLHFDPINWFFEQKHQNLLLDPCKSQSKSVN
jgi:hypothetical protein